MTTMYTLKDGSKLSGFFWDDYYTDSKVLSHTEIRVDEYDTNGKPIKIKDVRYPNEMVCKNHVLKVHMDENNVRYIMWKGKRINLEDWDYHCIPILIEEIEYGKKIKNNWFIHPHMILASLMKQPTKWGLMIPPRYAQFILPGTSIGITGDADKENPIPFIPYEEPLREVRDWHYKIKFVPRSLELRQYVSSEEYYFGDMVSLLNCGYLTMFEVQDTVAFNIDWDVDNESDLEFLPETIKIPFEIADNEDKISDYISDQTGFCHRGFQLRTE